MHCETPRQNHPHRDVIVRKWNVALGFYQKVSTAKAVVQELKSRNFLRYAVIYPMKEGGVEIKRHFLFPRIKKKIVNYFKDLVLPDEILVLVQVEQNDVREAIAILRQVKSGHPLSFLLRSDLLEQGKIEISYEPLTLEHLSEEAKKAAVSLKETYVSRELHHTLLKRLDKSSRILQFLRRDVADAEQIEQTFPTSAEWLLDNMYVIEGSIEEIRRNLPSKYYKELPKVSGVPRIYEVAATLVKGTAGRLTQDNITAFLTSYQEVDALTIGELWAFPLMLRLVLIEWIQFLAIRVDNRIREGEMASFWGNRLLYAAHHEPKQLPPFLEELSRAQPCPSPHFIEELLCHLFDDEAVVPLIHQWVDRCFVMPIADVLHHEQILETSEQVVFSNAIMSLITLSQLSWQEVFESVSVVDAILREDPLGIYSKMDFVTRNSYREAVEDIARHDHSSEVFFPRKVARRVSLHPRLGVPIPQSQAG